MKQNKSVSDTKASLCLKKIQKFVFEHDTAVFSGNLMKQPGVVNRRLSTVRKIYDSLMEVLNFPLPAIALDPENFNGQPAFVIGKKGDQYIYPSWPMAKAILHYCLKEGINIHDFLADDQRQCFQLESIFYRTSETYKMVSTDGKITEFTKDELRTKTLDSYGKD
jgi:hypothetical protein